MLRVLPIEVQGEFVGFLHLLLIAVFQLILHFLDVADDAIIKEVFEMRQAVEHPEGERLKTQNAALSL